MNSIAKPVTREFRLPVLRLPQLRWRHWKRRQTTIDLIHSSVYLRRDIGLLEEHVIRRQP